MEDDIRIKIMLAELDEPVPPWETEQRKAGGGKLLTYIAHEPLITKANSIFKVWSYSTDHCTIVDKEQYTNKDNKKIWRVTAISRVTTETPLGVRSGTGAATANLPGLGDAQEMALKSAETDALKRSLYNYGWALGLCLFDKGYLNALNSNDWMLYSPQYIEKKLASKEYGLLEKLKGLNQSRYRKYVKPHLPDTQDHPDNGGFEKSQAQGS